MFKEIGIQKKKGSLDCSPTFLFFQKHMYVLYMIMITFKTLSFNSYSQNSYDNDVRSLDLNKFKCSCGSTGHFHRHACYQRYLAIDASHTLLISIVRIKCESCGCTVDMQIILTQKTTVYAFVN